jgi:NADH:ubiquinone oxidoreductase subunit 3 (subunit A)
MKLKMSRKVKERNYMAKVKDKEKRAASICQNILKHLCLYIRYSLGKKSNLTKFASFEVKFLFVCLKLYILLELHNTRIEPRIYFYKHIGIFKIFKMFEIFISTYTGNESEMFLGSNIKGLYSNTCQ